MLYQLLKALLPGGPYSDDDNSLVLRDLAVSGAEFDRQQANADSLLIEFFPQSVDALIADWERVYGLSNPDGTALYLRIQRLVAKINMRPGFSILQLQESIFPFVGYLVEIQESAVFRADDPESLTDITPLGEDTEEVYRFKVIIDAALVKTPSFDRTALQEFVAEIKPAHTQGDVVYTGFFADDAASLTDLDLLSQ